MAVNTGLRNCAAIDIEVMWRNSCQNVICI